MFFITEQPVTLYFTSTVFTFLTFPLNVDHISVQPA